MNIKNYFAPILVICALLSACIAQGIQTSSSPVNSDNGDLTSTPANEMIHPSAPSQLSPTNAPIQTTAKLEFKQECMEVVPRSERKADGVLIFQEEFGSRLVFINEQKQTRKFVPSESNMQVYGAYVSPDRDWLIYQLDLDDPWQEPKFILTKSDGAQRKEMPYQYSWSSIFWLNNSAVRVADIDNAITYISNFAFNPFNETKVPLRSDFPDLTVKGIDWAIDRNAIEMGSPKGINIIYDPSLTRVLYPRRDNTIALFNLETNQEITRLSLPGRGKLPKWSLDGKRLAIIRTKSDSANDIVRDEFLFLSHDGSDVELLSYPLSFGKQIHIEDYSWSPDGSQIALWFKTDSTTSTTAQNPFELAVLDLQTNKITAHCVSGTPTIEYETYTDLAPIIWSPDSTQLLIVRYTDNKNTEEIIVDLTTRTIYKVAENMQPVVGCWKARKVFAWQETPAKLLFNIDNSLKPG